MFDMREIIILGRASGWEKAPDKRECWVVLSAIPHRLFQERTISRGFDMHSMENLRSTQIKCNNLVRQNEIPYYLQNVDPTIPTSVKYPLKEIIERFKTDYFSNSLTYMIALAIYEKVDKIDIYGVNMTKESSNRSREYALEKAGVEFWMGIAMGSGIELNIHGKRSEMLINHDGSMYGYGIPQKKHI